MQAGSRSCRCRFSGVLRAALRSVFRSICSILRSGGFAAVSCFAGCGAACSSTAAPAAACRPLVRLERHLFLVARCADSHAASHSRAGSLFACRRSGQIQPHRHAGPCARGGGRAHSARRYGQFWNAAVLLRLPRSAPGACFAPLPAPHAQDPGSRQDSRHAGNQDSRIELLALDTDRFGAEGNIPEPFTQEILRHGGNAGRILIDLATASGSVIRRILRMTPNRAGSRSA